MGYGRKSLEPHPIRLQGKYNDSTRLIRGIKLTYDEALAAYTCRTCHVWQGCSACLEDVANLICKNCRDWANDVSEKVHGKMVKDLELRNEAMKYVVWIYDGKITIDEYEKLWRGTRATMRELEKASALDAFRS